MIKLLCRALWLCLCWLACLPVHADELNVAVAANFLGTLQQLAPRFQQATGHQLVISSGATGQLYAQIKQGAPFDVFLAADAERPRLLEAAGLGVPGTRATYAIGTLVLWSPRPGVVDTDGKVLQGAQVRLLAIADPKSAPYGAAAQQVLVALGVWDEFNRDHRIAMGQDINQAWQFAATGNADLAFVAKSQLSALGQPGGSVPGSSWEPPQSLYSEIDQDGLVLTASTRRSAAESLMRWLRTDKQAIAAITAAGYRVSE